MSNSTISLLSQLFCMVFLVGCTATTAQTPKPASVPGWCKVAGLSGINPTEYIGRADGSSTREEAVKLAAAQGLSQLANELGMTVQSQSTLKQRETNGAFSSDVQLELSIASKPISVRGVRVIRQFDVLRTEGHTACAEVAIPAQEKERLKRVALNKTALVLHCRGDHIKSGACPTIIVNKVSAMLSTRGAQLLAGADHSRLDVSATKRALQQNAAYITAISIESRFLEEINGEFFAEANISLKRIDSTDQKALVSIEVSPEKAGHIAAREAELAAIDAALENLTRQLVAHTF